MAEISQSSAKASSQVHTATNTSTSSTSSTLTKKRTHSDLMSTQQTTTTESGSSKKLKTSAGAKKTGKTKTKEKEKKKPAKEEPVAEEGGDYTGEGYEGQDYAEYEGGEEGYYGEEGGEGYYGEEGGEGYYGGGDEYGDYTGEGGDEYGGGLGQGTDMPVDDGLEGEKFTIIPKDKIESMINQQIQEAVTLLNLEPEYAALVLQYFKWNVEDLTQKFFDAPDETISKAGVVLNPVKFDKPGPDAKVLCLICLDNVPFKETYNLPCGHRHYCFACWREYLDAQFQLRGAVMATDTKCLAPKCNVRIAREGYRKLASPTIFDKFNYFFVKSFIDQNQRFSYCPTSGCGNAVRYSGYGRPAEAVECTCGNKFCFKCGKEYHNPVSCENIDLWILKNQSDDESERLVKLLSKKCFHCGRMTERTQGCNHMHCRKDQGGCGGHWCWMCGGDWSVHGEQTGGYYSCNKYQASDRFKIDEENKKVEEEMKRFQFFYQRFFEHGVKAKDAASAMDKVKQRQMEFLEKTHHNPQFLMQAQEVLIKCRHALKYTYVFGYFLPQTHKFRPLFEDQQTKLEAVTERLADLAFAPVEKIDHQALKNQIRVAGSFMENMIQAFQEYVEK